VHIVYSISDLFRIYHHGLRHQSRWRQDWGHLVLAYTEEHIWCTELSWTSDLYRRLIKDFNTIMAPRTNVIKEILVRWNPKAQSAFEEINFCWLPTKFVKSWVVLRRMFKSLLNKRESTHTVLSLPGRKVLKPTAIFSLLCARHLTKLIRDVLAWV